MGKGKRRDESLKYERIRKYGKEEEIIIRKPKNKIYKKKGKKKNSDKEAKK
jgi:hypothetical protein